MVRRSGFVGPQAAVLRTTRRTQVAQLVQEVIATPATLEDFDQLAEISENAQSSLGHGDCGRCLTPADDYWPDPREEDAPLDRAGSRGRPSSSLLRCSRNCLVAG